MEQEAESPLDDLEAVDEDESEAWLGDGASSSKTVRGETSSGRG
jgi:hypothetical protein